MKYANEPAAATLAQTPTQIALSSFAKALWILKNSRHRHRLCGMN
jgi:hypothetical protein